MKSEEYQNLVKSLNKSSSYVAYYQKYFCNEKYMISPNTNEKIKYFEFSERRFAETESFFNGWEQRKQTIKARLRQNKYKSRGGRVGDIKALDKGDEKYAEISEFFALKPYFDQLEEMFPEEMQIVYEGGQYAEAAVSRIIQKLDGLLEKEGTIPQKQ